MPHQKRKTEIIPKETETKIPVEKLSLVRQKILELGGSHREEGEGVYFQKNTFLDTEVGRLSETDQLLRVREVRASSEEGELRKATVTWKGPREQQGGVFKSRSEIEVDVASPQTAIQLLNALGFTERLEVFEKRIEHLELDGVAIDLNEIPFLGNFVELEGSKEAIEAIVTKVGLPFNQATSRRYEELLAEYLKTRQLPADLEMDFTFSAAAQSKKD